MRTTISITSTVGIQSAWCMQGNFLRLVQISIVLHLQVLRHSFWLSRHEPESSRVGEGLAVGWCEGGRGGGWADVRWRQQLFRSGIVESLRDGHAQRFSHTKSFDMSLHFKTFPKSFWVNKNKCSQGSALKCLCNKKPSQVNKWIN